MTVLIDGAAIETRDELHDSLQAQLALPEYYGRTLDALYDCLTDIQEDTELRLLHAQMLNEQLGFYAGAMQRMICDACEENPHLSFVSEE